jgi:hypothetical protein
MTLRELFHSPPANKGGGWLFLSGDVSTWTLDTEAFFPDLDDEGNTEVPEEDGTVLDLQEVLDLKTVEDVVSWADRLVGESDDRVRFESLIYYYRFDAFLPEVGAPDPPKVSWEESVRQADLEFYDRLGVERPDKPCREPGCTRGSVLFSVLCRPHHFRSIKQKECPFVH